MTHRCLAALATGVVATVALASGAVAQEDGPYARIAVLRPHDGDTVDFEAGYIRHLDWHRQAKDTWAWFGWTIWAGERQRWFVYATFGHAAASLDNAVSPAEDERDNISNVTPHVEYVGNALYEYLPALSNGNGTPRATARLELTTVDVALGAEARFESALTAGRSSLQGETLWYRMIAGGSVPRYVRLQPRLTFVALLDSKREPVLPSSVNALVKSVTVEILNLRPAMSYGLPAAQP